MYIYIVFSFTCGEHANMVLLFLCDFKKWKICAFFPQRNKRFVEKLKALFSQIFSEK